MFPPHPSVYPTLVSPGYTIKSVRFLSAVLVGIDLFLFIIRSIDERTLVYFADNPRHILEAYVESKEGIDRAGGFAIQVRFLFIPCVCLPILIPLFLTNFAEYCRDLVEFWCERLRAIITMS